jgi:hypothetical protein
VTYRDDEAARRALRAERLQTLATRIVAIESWERDLERVDASVPDRPASLAEESSQRPRTVDDERPLDDAAVDALLRDADAHLALLEKGTKRRGLNFVTPVFDYFGRQSVGCLYLAACLIVPCVALAFLLKVC